MTKDEARREIGAIAQSLLSGEISYIAAALRINALCTDAELEGDPDVLCFVGIDSEADAFPIESVRQCWKPEALAKLEPEIARVEAWAREFGRAAAERLRDRFL